MGNNTMRLLFVILGICGSWSATALASATPPKAIIFGKAVHAQRISDVLTYPARVVPKVNTTVLAEIDGIVSQIPVHIGQKVRRQEALMEIRHTDPVYKYKPLKVESPIHGVVSSIDVSEGEQVVKGQKLGSVTDPRQLRVMIEAPAEDLDSLKAGLKGELKILGRDNPIPLRLKGVSPFVDPATGTATCEFALASKKSDLSPGLVGRLSIQVHSRKAIRIPEYSLIYRNDHPYVRIYDNGKVRFSAVKLGKKQEGEVEILSGLKDNQIVVERASRFVAEGEAVQLQKDKTGHSL